MIKQAALIFGCLFAGEFIVFLTKIQIPSSIIGMLLLTSLLYFKLIKVEQVKKLSSNLVSHMAFFFIPPGVAIVLYFDVIQKEFWAIALTSVISTFLVLAVTGWVYQLLKKHHD